MNLFAIGIIVLAIVILTIFSTFFASRLAVIKGRSKYWGILGFFLSIIGLIFVCFIPSKKNDGTNTNPILHFLKKIPAVSKRTMVIILVSAAAVVLTVTAYDYLPTVIKSIKNTTVSTDKRQQITFDSIDEKIENIFCSSNSTYILTQSKNLYCSGVSLLPNENGIIYKNVKKALSNDNQLFILDTDGKLFALGKNENKLIPTDSDEVSEPVLISEKVVDFSLSEKNAAYITEGKKLYILGDNTFSQAGNTDGKSVLSNVKKVCCEVDYTLILQHDGEVKVLGANTYGQFGIEGEYFTKPTSIAKDISDIAAGDKFILLLTKDGNVTTCGNNRLGQLGNGTFDSSAQFIQILDSVSSIYAAKDTAFALKANGELWAWGQNNIGQTGLGKQTCFNTPMLAAENISLISTSGTHTVVLNGNEEVLATGSSVYSQTGLADSSNKFSAFIKASKEN